MPDKAIDIIDEACSKTKMTKIGASIGEDIGSENSLKKRILEIKESKNLSSLIEVTEQEVQEIVSDWVGVPVKKLTSDDIGKLKKLEDALKKNIIGQDEAVMALAKAIKRSRVGIRDPKRPIASFLLTGPTGVGKTALVKTLAATVFDSETNLIRVDMSEYMEPHSVSKLIGAPPGYIGFSEGGQLTEKVRKKPYSIVLFDEIEKAHPDVYNMLLQILDEGRLTDAMGKVVNFKNTICIMTSNIGARNITDNKNLGFITKESKEEEYKKMKTQVMADINKHFNPEFLNRLDDIIVFNRLDKTSINKITRLMLKDVEKRAKLQGIKIKFEDSVVDYISKVGFDDKKGARPLKRAIQSKIEDKFADYVLDKKISTKDSIYVSFSENQEGIVMQKRIKTKTKV